MKKRYIITVITSILMVVLIAGIQKIILEEVRPEDMGGRTNLATHKALLYLQGAIAMMVHDNYPKVTIEYLYPSEWRKCCNIKTGRGVVRETVKQRDIRFVQETFGIVVNDDIADELEYDFSKISKITLVPFLVKTLKFTPSFTIVAP